MFPVSYNLYYIFLSIIVIYLIYSNWTRRKLYMAASKYEGSFAYPLIGNALEFRGDQSRTIHKAHRRIIQPMMSLNFIQTHTANIQKHIDRCMEKFDSFVKKKSFDIHDVIHNCFLDIMKELLFGHEENSQLNGKTDFDKALIGKSQERREQALSNSNCCSIIDKINDFLDDKPGYFDEEVYIDHILSLYAASEDTLSLNACFLLYCLGMYPDYQAKAAEEIRRIFGENPRPVTLEDIKQVPYIDMCLKETYRLFPIGPYILRNCPEDFQLDQWTIPAGATIVIPIFNIHRNETYWVKPNEFYPDHFLPEAVDERPTFAFIPFSVGSRSCIGKIFANTFLKIFACSFLQRFEVEADGKVPDLKLEMDISVRAIGGYNVKLKKRIWQ